MESSRPVMVFDGDCAFCRQQVERIRRRDAGGRFEYVPWQQPGLRERFPQLAEGDLEAGMRLIEPDGRVLIGADAVHAVAARLPRWRWLAPLYRVPGLRGLTRFGYRWIARRRHLFGGRVASACRSGACAPSENPSADSPGSARGANEAKR